MPPGKTHLASMGIYVIKREKLAELVAPETARDFGKDVIPGLLKKGLVQAHIFQGYWEDIGTVAAYYRETLALTDPHPAFDMFDPTRPVLTRPRFLPPTRIIVSCQLDRALISEGCVLRECRVVHSVIGIRTIIGKGASIEDTVLLGHDFYEDPAGGGPLGIGEGAVVRGAIIDKNVRIGKGVRILNEAGVKEADNELYSIKDGIVCIPKGVTIPDGMVI
jgi:glucose-1-phosphate adenylyltransferase